MTTSAAAYTERWKERMMRSAYFFIALLLHLVVLLMVGTLVIWQATSPASTSEFHGVRVAVPPPPPAPPLASGSAAANAQFEPQAVAIPVVTPSTAITSVNNSFTVDATKVQQPSLVHVSLPPPQGTGLDQGAGDFGHGTGLSKSADFFGVHAGGKRIAFLLDYSGSMSGEFRKTMERQLVSTLGKLPPDTQIIIICWAGPAWLVNQTAPQIAGKWKKLGNQYDNFTLVPGATLDAPQWMGVDPNTVDTIMQGIKAQVAAPGGTDWRQPFRYAMKADPPPDAIFFLTDGQIPEATADRALSAIGIELRRAAQQPQINCLWIENKENKSDEMEKLAKKYNGEFRRVSAKGVQP